MTPESETFQKLIASGDWQSRSTSSNNEIRLAALAERDALAAQLWPEGYKEPTPPAPEPKVKIYSAEAAEMIFRMKSDKEFTDALFDGNHQSHAFAKSRWDDAHRRAFLPP